MKTHEVNAALASLGYSPISDDALLALLDSTGGLWETWLSDVQAIGTQSENYKDFRHALMAVSTSVDAIFRALKLNPSSQQKIKTFLKHGHRLSKATQAFMREGLTMPNIEIRREYLSHFNHGKSAKTAEIAKKVHRVFTQRTGMTFEAAETREGKKCLQLEAATRQSNDGRFDWERKIAVQLNDAETMEMLAVLQGHLDSAEFQHHGQANDKRVSITRRQDGNTTVSVRKGGVARMVPVPPFEVFKITALALQVLTFNSPELPPDALMAMCRTAASSRRG